MLNIIAAIALIVLLFGISWSICIGIIYLICLCFSWNFSIIAATGVWLIILLVKGAFHVEAKK